MSDIKGMDFNYLMQNQQKINSSLSIQERDNKKIIEYDSKIVSFRIGNQFYGIDIMMVKEILCEKNLLLFRMLWILCVGCLICAVKLFRL